MKTAEFRKGNTIELDGEIFDIASIGGDETIRLKVPYGGSIGCFSVNRINPIPLREEWLLKFGFKDSFELISEEGFIFQCAFDGDDFIKNQKTLLVNKALAVKIKYVHQLQNIFFALTNTELSLND